MGAATARAAKRNRFAEVALAFGAKTASSLGEHAERLMANCGTDVFHLSPLPQALLELAGTTAVWAELDKNGPAEMRIPPPHGRTRVSTQVCVPRPACLGVSGCGA